MNRIAPSGLPLYQKLHELVKEKDYFALTTSVDAQFEKAGFDTARIFATQGDYGKIQCAKGCHRKVYDAHGLFESMNKARTDCRIPTDMVSKCPVCGGPMTMHLRTDSYFVENENWHEMADRYGKYLENALDKNTVLLELGVGLNTPTIIRFPFEKMMREHTNLQMIRLNWDEAFVPEGLGQRMIGIQVPEKEKRKMFRSLRNIRMPKPISKEFLRIQDTFLQEETDKKGVVALQDIPTIRKQFHSCHFFSDKISVWQGDITRLAVDGIVNAAIPVVM